LLNHSVPVKICALVSQCCMRTNVVLKCTTVAVVVIANRRTIQKRPSKTDAQSQV